MAAVFTSSPGQNFKFPGMQRFYLVHFVESYIKPTRADGLNVSFVIIFGICRTEVL